MCKVSDETAVVDGKQRAVAPRARRRRRPGAGVRRSVSTSRCTHVNQLNAPPANGTVQPTYSENMHGERGAQPITGIWAEHPAM